MEAVYSSELLFILDWDNTLIPSKWLETKGFRVLPHGTSGLTPDMIAMCESIAPYVAALINGAKRYGRVIIITNATESWVRLGCTIFMPSISELVLSLPIISAADLYSEIYTNPMMWKKLAFQREVVDMGFRTVISIGDGEAERNAALALSKTKQIIVKSLKFMDDPMPDALVKQLDGTIKAMHMLATHKSPLDIMWLASEFDTKENPFEDFAAKGFAECPVEVTPADPNVPLKKSQSSSSKPARSPTPKPRYDHAVVDE